MEKARVKLVYSLKYFDYVIALQRRKKFSFMGYSFYYWKITSWTYPSTMKHQDGELILRYLIFNEKKSEKKIGKRIMESYKFNTKDL